MQKKETKPTHKKQLKQLERNGRAHMYYYSDGAAFPLNMAFTLMPLLLFKV